jgi:hypothetical protein
VLANDIENATSTETPVDHETTTNKPQSEKIENSEISLQ